MCVCVCVCTRYSVILSFISCECFLKTGKVFSPSIPHHTTPSPPLPSSPLPVGPAPSPSPQCDPLPLHRLAGPRCPAAPLLPPQVNTESEGSLQRPPRTNGGPLQVRGEGRGGGEGGVPNECEECGEVDDTISDM